MANQIPLSTLSKEAGGAILPVSLAETVIKQVQAESGALQLVDTEVTNSKSTTFPIVNGTPEATNITENVAITEDGAEFDDLSLTVAKSGVIVPVTNEALSDSAGNIEALLNDRVPRAIAQRLDGNIVGAYKNGGATTSPYDSNLTDDAGDSVVFGTDGDAIRKAVSAGIGVLESEGYRGTGVLLGGDSAQLIRDARSQTDNTVAAYSGLDSIFYGATPATSTNLHRISDAEEDDVVGFVLDRDYCKFLIRSDITFAVSGSAGDSFEKDKTKLRWVVRAGFVLTDPRAVVAITKGAIAS